MYPSSEGVLSTILQVLRSTSVDVPPMPALLAGCGGHLQRDEL